MYPHVYAWKAPGNYLLEERQDAREKLGRGGKIAYLSVFFKVGIRYCGTIIHSIFCCFKPVRAHMTCPDSNPGLSSSKKKKQACSFQLQFACVSKEEGRRRSKPSHKYRSDPIVFLLLSI